MFLVAAKRLSDQFPQKKSDPLGLTLAVAKDGLIYARSITRNIRRGLRRKKRLNS